MRLMLLHSFRYLILFWLVCGCAPAVEAQLIPGLGPSASSASADDESTTLDSNAIVPKKANAFESELEKYQSLEKTFREKMPESLRETSFLLAHYQWISCFVLVFLGLFVDVATRFVLSALVRLARKDSSRGDTESDKLAEQKVWKPIGLLAQAATWYYGSWIIGFPLGLMKVLAVGLKLFAVFAAVWTTFRIIDWIAGFIARKALGTKTKFDDLLVPLIQKCLKTFAVCTGIIFFADVFDLEVTAIVGGLGLGGAALAFASQDTLSNLFGSLTVLADRPFEIGDWIVSDGVEGTVENVGMRSTRVRTFYNSLITLPNSRLTTSVVDNMGRRQFRRFTTSIGVQYDTTPEQIDAFCEGIREIIRRHPYTRKDYFQVYLNGFGASSVDILLYMFFKCDDWPTELRERHRLLIDVMKLAANLGVQFAFPTQTLHMFQEDNNVDYASLHYDDPPSHGQDIASTVTGPHMAREDYPPVDVVSGKLRAAEMPTYRAGGE